MRDVLGKRMCCWEFRIDATPNPIPAGMATHSLCRHYGVCVCVKLSFHLGYLKNLTGRHLEDFRSQRKLSYPSWKV